MASSKKDREDYHERVESELMTLLEKGKKKGNTVEKIARTLSKRRNEIRLEEAEALGTLDETKKGSTVVTIKVK